jgi:hypothetical protein
MSKNGSSLFIKAISERNVEHGISKKFSSPIVKL